MKKLHFVKPNDLSRLHDQLLAAFPTLRLVDGIQVKDGVGDSEGPGGPANRILAQSISGV